MSKPFLIIINGLPGVGKTTMTKRLSIDLHMPAFHRDEIAERMFDGLDCVTNR